MTTLFRFLDVNSEAEDAATLVAGGTDARRPRSSYLKSQKGVRGAAGDKRGECVFYVLNGRPSLGMTQSGVKRITQAWLPVYNKMQDAELVSWITFQYAATSGRNEDEEGPPP